MSKFKVGDKVTFIYNHKRINGEITRTGLLDNGKPYSEVKVTNFKTQGYYVPLTLLYDVSISLDVSDIPIEKQLVTKINQLYERQQWVKDGKPEATYYATRPALSAEKKDMIITETILESTPMVTLSASDVVTNVGIPNPALNQIIPQGTWRIVHTTTGIEITPVGQEQYLNEPLVGSNNRISAWVR